jgi:hypothetical protein
VQLLVSRREEVRVAVKQFAVQPSTREFAVFNQWGK